MALLPLSLSICSPYGLEVFGDPGSRDLPLYLQEDIAKLLRYESSALPAGQLTSLQDYAGRMQPGTRNIYYLCAPTRHLAEHSPYYEAMKQKNTEVGEHSREALNTLADLEFLHGAEWEIARQTQDLRQTRQGNNDILQIPTVLVAWSSDACPAFGF